MYFDACHTTAYAGRLAVSGLLVKHWAGPGCGTGFLTLECCLHVAHQALGATRHCKIRRISGIAGKLLLFLQESLEKLALFCKFFHGQSAPMLLRSQETAASSCVNSFSGVQVNLCCDEANLTL
jgi:hypothetical protein